MRTLTCTVILLLVATCCPGMEIDPKDAPNEDGDLRVQLLMKDATTPEQIYAYFSHYSPVIRINASRAMHRKGKTAMPFILRGLAAEDRHIARAACDAISAFTGWSSSRMNREGTMTPEIVSAAVPGLVLLLKREDVYLRDGALLALSCCGKAAAPHLETVATFLKADDWWLREAATLVIRSVGSPEADTYVVDLAWAITRERRIMCLQTMRDALKVLLKTSANGEDVALTLGKGLREMERDFIRQRGRDVLNSMGTNAVAALPLLTQLIEEGERHIKASAAEGEPDSHDQADLDNLKKTRAILAGE